MRLLFGEWTPDQPPHLSKGVQVAKNVYPAANGYRPVKSLSVVVSTLGTPCRGASAFVTPSGQGLIIAGTSFSLWRAYGGAWTQLGAFYNMQGDDRWRFAQFGGLAIATNGVDDPVAYDLEEAAIGGPYLPVLGGSPPKMKLLAVVKDFLVGGVIDGDVHRLQWSGINDAEFWTPGQRQSDYQIMPTGGDINGLIGGEFGLVLQRNRVSRMDYVGGNVIFAFNEISTNIGCVSVHSVIQSGQLAFWRSDNGFIMWDGANLKPIGNERVDRYFDSLYSKSDWASASTAVDAKNNTVIWSMGDRMFVYNWVLDRWTLIEQAAEIIFGGVQPGLGLDELDSIYGNLDAIPVSLDDVSLVGGDPQFYIVNTAHELCTFSGPNKAATLTFGDIEMAQGRDVRLRSARPLTDATDDLTLTMGTRQRLGDAPSETSYTTITASGDMPLRERGRYVRPSLAHAEGASWTYTQGLEVTGERGARR